MSSSTSISDRAAERPTSPRHATQRPPKQRVDKQQPAPKQSAPAPSRFGRTFALRAVGVGIGLGLFGLAMLAVLPMLPVMVGIHYSDPLPGALSARYEPGEYVNSLAWDLREPVHGHINAEGFISPKDFSKDQPAIGLFGDSFVEGLMIPYAESLPAQVASRLAQRASKENPGAAPLAAYNFGFSAASLPHYLGLAREMSAQYRLKSAVFVIIPGDYDEGFMAPEGQYNWNDSVDESLIHAQPPQPRAGLKKKLRDSSTLQYLRGNLRVEALPLFAHPGAAACPPATLTPLDEQRLSSYVAALPAALKMTPENIVMVFNRYPYSTLVYEPIDHRKSAPVCPTRDSLALDKLQKLAAQSGVKVLDTIPLMQKEYAVNHRLLDFSPVDRHWSSRAIEIVAQAVAANLP